MIPESNENLKKMEETALRVIQTYLKTGGFTNRTLADTPTDSLQVVPRKYVTLNGTTANRPTSSVIGQRYFDTTLNKPVWVGNSFAWVDATGTPA